MSENQELATVKNEDPQSSKALETPTSVTPTPVTETSQIPTPVTPTPVIETSQTPTPVTPTPVTETSQTPTPVTPTPVTETSQIPTSVTPTPVTETSQIPTPKEDRFVAVKNLSGKIFKGTPPRFQAYLEQWPRTFLTWFLALLALSLVVWRFIPGGDTISTYTPAQGLLVPISVFGGPAIIAAFIATHSGIGWYSETLAVKNIGLVLIDYFLKLRSLIVRNIPFGKGYTRTDRVMDLAFPALGREGFQQKYLAKTENYSSEEILETVTRYQLDHLGSIALNFFTVYVLVKLPTIILWEALSLVLEWSVYRFGFWAARVPFPDLTLYHWELFVLENIAVAFVIFFKEVNIDSDRTKTKELMAEHTNDGTKT